MRKFHSYGPVDIEDHFCVERQELTQKCTNQLICDFLSDQIKYLKFIKYQTKFK